LIFRLDGGVSKPEPPKLLETPKGGTKIVTGIGLYTNSINSGLFGAKWIAGELADGRCAVSG
jgi:hypothetical protein